MKKLLLCIMAIGLLFAAESFAVPARPVKHLIKQPDGSSLEVYLRGDEFLHYYVTTDNVLLQQADNGYWKYAVLSENGLVIAGKYTAKNQNLRPEEEKLYIKEIDKASLSRVLNEKAAEARAVSRQKSGPGTINKEFPTTGVVRGLVILVEYQDVKLSENATLDVFKDLLNKKNYEGDLAYGSARDYFIDQSNGLFTPEFDVVGPITLPHERAFYGGGSLGKENAHQMIIDACLLVDKDVDFSHYDCNGDNIVDYVYVVYAGHGEAQGGPVESVWPQSGELYYEYVKPIDGVYLNKYSCSCELRGDKGNEIDGIGTFCHEFSHILGLPDIYDATYSGGLGLENWDVMDRGSYNDDSKTPAGYTAMDKYTVGWLTPTLLEDPQDHVSLESLSSSNKACFIVNPKNVNEYYTLENRQLEGWDSKLPGSGLMICHIDYDMGVWKANHVNSKKAGHDHVMLIEADGTDVIGEPGDLFPGPTQRIEFTDDSQPGATWWTGGKVGKPIRNIEEKDGIIYFDFISDGSGIETISGDQVRISLDGHQVVISNPDKQRVIIYSIEGRQVAVLSESANIQLSPGIYVVKAGDNNTIKICVKD